LDSHTSTPDPAALTAAIAGMGFVSVFFLAVIVFSLFLNWRIASKAGYSGALSLLLLVPIVNLVVIVMFAFSEWPIQKALKLYTGGGGGMMPPGTPMWTPPPTQPSAGPYLPPGA
jgi:hypothetical protein